MASSEGFKRGSVVRHPQWGVVHVGGTMGGRISLHRMSDGHRVTQKACPADCRVLTYNAWKFHWAPPSPSKVASPLSDEEKVHQSESPRLVLPRGKLFFRKRKGV
ncbi:hypothetical protein CO251_00120 [Sulfobacillus sp. hq2]|nr:hypothetical protein CO251_00120 [Sulfobacillus sp. hq2]